MPCSRRSDPSVGDDHLLPVRIDDAVDHRVSAKTVVSVGVLAEREARRRVQDSVERVQCTDKVSCRVRGDVAESGEQLFQDLGVDLSCIAQKFRCFEASKGAWTSWGRGRQDPTVRMPAWVFSGNSRKHYQITVDGTRPPLQRF